jgi:hypothetical protein
MKRFPGIATLLLLGVLALGWRDHVQLAALRAEREKLLSRAAVQGLPVDPANPSQRLLPAKLLRPDRAAQAKQAAAAFIAYAGEMKALGEGGKLDPSDPATRQRMMEQMDRLDALDAEQWKILIAELYGAAGDPYERRDMIVFSLNRLMEEDPSDALRVLVDTPGMVELIRHNTSGFFENLIYRAMKLWSEAAPSAALQWLNENRGKIPEDTLERVNSALISGTATTDLRKAMQLMKEFDQPAETFLSYLLARPTIEGKNMSLTLLREWQAGDPAVESRAEVFKDSLKTLAFGVSGAPENFDHATAWITQAGLSAAELKLVASDLENHVNLPESGRWMEWLFTNLPEEQASRESWRIFDKWLKRDYRAVGTWLESVPDGAPRRAGVQAYVDAIFPKEPDNAIRWALSLPASKEREETLSNIYRKWPRGDDAAKQAAEAFATEHGIDKE